MKIFVCNLHYCITEHELCFAFKGFGAVHKCNLIVERDTGKSKGYGFITMDTPDALVAITELDQKTICGRRISVQEWLPRKDRAA